MRMLLTVLATALTAGALVAVPAEASAPSAELQPESLTRGADIAVPHIEDGDFVDGARRIDLPGTIARRLREGDGTRLATWSTNWFSGWEWESPGAVLLEVNGRRKSATVRCVLAQCENATDPVQAQAP